MTAPSVSDQWSYSINYGPDGEEDWANLITPEGTHVANIRTHHAVRIVSLLEALDAAGKALEPFGKCIDRLAPGDDIAHWRLTDALDHGLTVADVIRARTAIDKLHAAIGEKP